MIEITSKENNFFKEFKKLSQDSGAVKKLGKIWLEGEHLCQAADERGIKPDYAVLSATFAQNAPHQLLETISQRANRVFVIADSLMSATSQLPSAAKIAYVLDMQSLIPAGEINPKAPSVILDRVQDAGNAGTILRSAAAFGFTQILAIKGSARLWSSKVLRAGMGAHFGLKLYEGLTKEDIKKLQIPILATSSHAGEYLHKCQLPAPCAWLFGNEGGGVDLELMEFASKKVQIIQPAGQESLNVAAAASICLHQSAANMNLN